VMVANSIWSGLAIGLLAALAYFPFAATIHERFLHESPLYYEVIGVVLLPVTQLNYNLATVFTGLKQLKPHSIWTVCTAVMTLTGAGLVGAAGLGVGGMVILYAIVVPISTAAVYLWLLNRRGLLSMRGDFNQWRRSVQYGIRGYIANLLQFFNFRLDSMIVAAYRGATEVGLYSLAVLLTEFLWMFGNSVAVVLFPTTAGQSEGQANRLTARACRQVVWITLAEALALAATAWWLVPFIFGQEYRSSVIPLWLLLPGTVALIIPNVLNAHFAGRGRPQIGAMAAGVSLVITVGLDLALIPVFGIVGAAIASSVAYTVAALVVLSVFHKATGLPWSAVLIVNADDGRYLLSLVARGRMYLAGRGPDLRSEP